MTDCAARSWRAALGFSCCELCSLHVCAEDPPTKERKKPVSKKKMKRKRLKQGISAPGE